MIFTYIKLGILIAILSIIGGLVFAVQTLRLDLQISEENLTKVNSAYDAQTIVLNQKNYDIEKMRDVNSRLDEKYRMATKTVSDLERKFKEGAAGKPRDLNSLAIKEPKLIENKINRGTKQALRCNEVVTGSPLTQDELSGKEINHLCPNLFPKPKAATSP